MAEKGGDEDPCMSRDGQAGSDWWGRADTARPAAKAAPKPPPRDEGVPRLGYVRTNLGRILRSTEPMRSNEFAVSACDDGGHWRGA